MKITAFIISTLCMLLSLVSCGVDEPTAQSKNETSTTNSTSTTISQTETQNGVYIYSLENILDFSHNRMWQSGSYIYWRYYNDELIFAKNNGFVYDSVTAQNSISLSWNFEHNGQSALQHIIENQGLVELSNMPSYYYAYASDHNYIYWCEDNYRFYSRIPTSVGTINTEAHEYSGEDVFKLKKTFYPFETE